MIEYDNARSDPKISPFVMIYKQQKEKQKKGSKRLKKRGLGVDF